MYTNSVGSGAALQQTGYAVDMGKSQAVKPSTPLQSRLNDLNDCTSSLEEAVMRLYARFEHLLPQLPPGGEAAGGGLNSPAEPVKSEVSLRIDDTARRLRRVGLSLEAFMDRCEA